MSSSKRVRKTPADRLSALPESILVRILSFLDMNQSAITSVLSKRWQSLWTESPRLVFKHNETGDVSNFVTRVNRTLVVCGRNNIDTLSVNFPYADNFAPDVNVWVDFALRNRVKRLCLLLTTSDIYSIEQVHFAYTLPQKMYRNSCLEGLSLQACVVGPRKIVEWWALTHLTIEWSELSQHVLERILSGCPVLHRFALEYCWGFDRVETESKSLRLRELVVSDPIGKKPADVDPVLRITAPYVHSLWICVRNAEKRRLQLGDVSSLVRVNIDLIVSRDVKDVRLSSVMGNAGEILEKVRHVKEFHSEFGFTDVLTLMAMDEYKFPQSARTSLHVHARSRQRSSSEYSMYGYTQNAALGRIGAFPKAVGGLIESSPNLEALTIEGTDFFVGPYISPDPTGVLSCDLLHLKTIIITDYLESNFYNKPTINLARILLKSTPALEKMVFNIQELIPSSPGRFYTSPPYQMATSLLCNPRSSPKAVVLFNTLDPVCKGEF